MGIKVFENQKKHEISFPLCPGVLTSIFGWTILELKILKFIWPIIFPRRPIIP